MGGSGAPGPAGPSDGELIAGIQVGDDEAMAALYRRYGPRTLGYFRRMLGSLEAAEDAVQELFLKVLDAADRISTERDVGSWLFAAAHNMCCNEYRSRQVRLRARDDLRHWLVTGAPAEGAHTRAEARSFQQRLHEELGRLSAHHRSTFLLRFQEGLALQQIGAIVGVPTGTVKSRLHTACRLLADRLRPFDPHLEEVGHALATNER